MAQRRLLKSGALFGRESERFVPSAAIFSAVDDMARPARLAKGKTATERLVPVDDLIATQTGLNPNFMNGPHLDKKSLPLVYQLGGKLFLGDGHHRAASALARGERSLLARVFDLDSGA